jgi:hypothetical protein
MHTLKLALLGIGLVSVTAIAQPSGKPQCPPGYQLAGPVCQDSSSGDIVLPN